MAGATTAALFLEQYVDTKKACPSSTLPRQKLLCRVKSTLRACIHGRCKSTMGMQVEWAHIDIAGPAWDEKQGQATGFGAAVLAEWVLKESLSTSQ